MAAPDNLLHQRRVSLGYPSQHEKGTAYSAFVEQIENPLGVGLHATWKLVPFRAVDHAGEGLHVEIVLHINR